ncbi:hypothetical protein NL676_023815 [Syzygium grande]|nr:hypothetical protein NL676_023815 [Syzygium grande]
MNVKPRRSIESCAYTRRLSTTRPERDVARALKGFKQWWSQWRREATDAARGRRRTSPEVVARPARGGGPRSWRRSLVGSADAARRRCGVGRQEWTHSWEATDAARRAGRTSVVGGVIGVGVGG